MSLGSKVNLITKSGGRDQDTWALFGKIICSQQQSCFRSYPCIPYTWGCWWRSLIYALCCEITRGLHLIRQNVKYFTTILSIQTNERSETAITLCFLLILEDKKQLQSRHVYGFFTYLYVKRGHLTREHWTKFELRYFCFTEYFPPAKRELTSEQFSFLCKTSIVPTYFFSYWPGSNSKNCLIRQYVRPLRWQLTFAGSWQLGRRLIVFNRVVSWKKLELRHCSCKLWRAAHC